MIRGFLNLWRAGALTKYAEFAAAIALAMLSGIVIGQHITTAPAVRTAVETVQAAAERAQDRAAREEADVSAALIKRAGDNEKRAAEQVARAQHADDHVHAKLTTAEREAAKDRDAALAQLLMERETNDGLRHTTEILAGMANTSVGRCWFSSNARRVLDQAAGAVIDTGNRGAGPNAAETEAAGAAAAAGSAPAGAADGLTCDQLFRGYAALGEHDRNAVAKADAWRQWYRETFPEE
jgi:hypothetical protein